MATASDTVLPRFGTPLRLQGLPPLREDLELLPAPPGENGAPAWMLYDPLRHQFFRLGRAEFEILSRWQLGGAEAIATAVNRKTTLTVTPEYVQEVAQFCRANQLLRLPVGAFGQNSPENRGGFFRLALSFLYHRAPLWQPDAFLAAILPFTRFWFWKGFWQTLFFLGLLGGYLTLRQWDQFLHTFTYLYSLEGWFSFVLALTMVKAGHELAHACTAKRHGLKVPVMGVAFVMFWPILYTDTTDGWRLPAKKARLQIAIAGVAFELAVAILATIFWHLLPMGPAKGVMFLLASTTWLMTIAVNLNPFMRYDGYYLLSDLLNLPNLQPRAFALCRWLLRRLLLGADLPCPEPLSLKRKIIMLGYGYATWLYRLLLFSTIALLLYHFFFKALGLLFLAGELWVLVFFPIIRELRVWAGMRSQLRLKGRPLVSGGLLLTGFLLLFYPWQTAITIPAVYRARNYSRIFVPEGARVRENLLENNRLVEKGAPLLLLESPALASRKIRAELEAELLETQLERLSFSAEEAEQLPVAAQRLVEAMTELAGVNEEEQQLRLLAPIQGTVREVADFLAGGRWVRETEQVAAIVDLENMLVEGYVHEEDFPRVHKGAPGRFYPADPALPPVRVKVKNLAESHMATLPSPLLASTFGGDLPVREEGDGTLSLRQSLYQVALEPLDRLPGGRMVRGTVKIQGDPVSLAARIWTAIQAVTIRESDF